MGTPSESGLVGVISTAKSTTLSGNADFRIKAIDTDYNSSTPIELPAT
jgi:hypothetical protein